LVVGSALTALVFLFHPSHVSPGDLAGTFSLSQVVHGTAIVSAPLLVFGLWELSRWIGRPLARLGLAAGAIGLVLTVNAAVISSFVTPAAARASGALPAHAPVATPAGPAAGDAATHHPMSITDMPPLVRLSVSMNRGFAQAHVTLISMALLLFGLALWGRSRALAAAGIVVGAGPLLWQLTGLFAPETGTMPFVVFPQCAWLVATALMMASAPKPEGMRI
jgi:hypothetical protein